MALKVEISAETKEQADTILNALLDKKLVTGGQIITAPARFLWKGEIVDMDYCTITSFTVERHRKAVIQTAEAHSEEEVPMIVFLAFEGNPKLAEWIEQTCA